MPYSGGSSTASGVEYQNWFLALQVAYSFFEKDRVIFPEVFTDNTNIIDDIKIVQGKQSTYYNVKHRSPAESLHWNLAQLTSQNVVKHIKQQFEANPNANIVFVSESNCYLITEVFMRATNANSPMDIDMALESQRCIQLWEQAREAFDYDDFRLLALARKTTMRSVPLYEIKKLIEHRFITLGNHMAVSDLFFTKCVQCSANKTRIDKENINLWLSENGISFNLR
ncbi:MAG: hypothetical protein CL613_04365 [Aquimarina sp.]|nr:hypothetical protein [Aquimarina sp.]